MKLNVPILGQRDPQWASITLGFNTDPQYSIGLYGCAITCFAMITGKKPDEVNQILKDNKAYQKGTGNIIWSSTTCLGINQQYLSPSWTALATDAGVQKAKDLLDQGFPLICEIDFNPATNGEEMHFVVITGYDGDVFYINDPWTDDATTFDKYGGFKRAVIQYRSFDQKFTPADAPALDDLSQCRLDRDNHWNDLMAIMSALNLSGTYSLAIVLGEIKKLLGYEDQIRERDQQLDDLKQKIANMEGDLTQKTTQIAQMQKDNDQLKADSAQKIADMQKSFDDQTATMQKDFNDKMSTQDGIITTLKTQLENLQNELKSIKESANYPTYSGFQLILTGFGKLFGRK